MRLKELFLFITLIISAFLCRNYFAIEKTIANKNNSFYVYRVSELKTTVDRTGSGSLLITDNAAGEVLQSRTARALHSIKPTTIISSTALVGRRHLKHAFYTSSDPFILPAELLLFPHHAFW